MNMIKHFIYKFTLVALVICNCNLAFAQLEKVIVERYYVSDANDATDTFGGGVPEGSVTYRIYIDMTPGSVLKSLYGDALHPFSISSTESFFNHETDGQTFAKEFIKNRYSENTVALDTWLTLGQTTKKQGNITYFGILKDQDVNGTFIGGINNDGGSAEIATGLLINDDISCGQPLTIADGMDTLVATPSDWFSNGILDFVSGNDSTIFGSLVDGTELYSESFSLSATGVVGVIADSNQVIVAQLTTKGDLSFILNLEIEYEVNGVPTTFFYVGTNNITMPNEVYSPYLTYPALCGCNDPNYLEYSPAFICGEAGSCVTPVVLGCTDSLACNFDPTANTNVSELCCYPGWCNNRNLEEVCPQLKGNSFDFTVFPNPASDMMTLNVINGVTSDLTYIIYNSYGTILKQRTMSQAPLNFSDVIDLSDITPGMYSVKVMTDQGEQHKLFVRL